MTELYTRESAERIAENAYGDWDGSRTKRSDIPEIIAAEPTVAALTKEECEALCEAVIDAAKDAYDDGNAESSNRYPTWPYGLIAIAARDEFAKAFALKPDGEAEAGGIDNG